MFVRVMWIKLINGSASDSKFTGECPEWLDQPKFADYWHAEVMRLRRLLKEGQTHDPRF